jgi:hypothetical protein
LKKGLKSYEDIGTERFGFYKKAILGWLFLFPL